MGTKLGSSNQEASPASGKTTGVVLVPCHTWKCDTIAISGGVDTYKVPGTHLLWQISSHWESQKSLQGSMSCELKACLFYTDPFLTQWNSHII